MINYEKEILILIKDYYKGIQKDIDKWYKTPHGLIEVYKSKSPKEYIDEGNAKKVLDYLKTVLK